MTLDPEDKDAVTRLALVAVEAARHLRAHQHSHSHQSPPDLPDKLDRAIDAVRFTLGLTPTPATQIE